MALLDNFNRANENPIAGPNWVNVISSCQIASNQVAFNSISFSETTWAASTFGPDGRVQTDVPVRPGNTGKEVSLHWRMSSSSSSTRNGYRLRWARGGNAIINRVDAGVETTILTVSLPTFNDGDVIRVTFVGSVHTIFRNGVAVPGGSVTDGTYLGAGYVGMGGSFSTGNNVGRLDHFDAETALPTFQPQAVMM